MLQSSGALSAYPKSICLSSGIILPGTCKGDFYNRFYIIQLKFKINHCTWRAWEQSAGCRLPLPPKRQSVPYRHQHTSTAIHHAFPHTTTCRKARHPATDPLQRHPPRFPSCRDTTKTHFPPERNKAEGDMTVELLTLHT